MTVAVMDWLRTRLDIIDLIVLTIVLLTTVYYSWRSWIGKTTNKFTPTVLPSYTSPSNSFDRQTSFVARMKSEERKVLIIYGSQTGTAEELAGRLSKDVQNYGQKALLLDPEEMNVEDFEKIKEIPGVLLILFMATYGEGDPTDNAQEFYQHVLNTDLNLTGVNFAVFGLGNKTYGHFNEIAKYFNRRMEEFGATRIYSLGLGDDDRNLEEDFMRWREGFWSAITNIFGWEIAETGSLRQYRLEIVEDFSVKLFTGEYGRLGSFEKQRPPFNQKNPFIATVNINRELHDMKSDRSCRHIEFIISEARMRYEVGDHLGVFPTNDPVFVEELGQLLDADMDLRFSLVNLDEENLKKNPFPCPCTVRTAFTHYVDICAPVKSNVLKALASFTSAEDEKERLLLLSTANEQGLKEYGNYIQKERRSIIDILRAFPTCKPPVDYVLELLPRLQPRYYSISSSSKYDRELLAITVVVTRYMIGNRLVKGVCTNFLLQKGEGSKVPIFVRKSTMRLPHRLETPVIMIGPGTGFAPFRGFLQERSFQKKQGQGIGPMILYYGCRHPEQDYIYEEELKKFIEDGVLSELHTAFSRVTAKKIYVQDEIWKSREAIWRAVEDGANIFICGDARNMARDVQNTFIRIFMEVGGKTEIEAQKFQKDLERKRCYQTDVWS
ncbi:FAD binding domain-containing protein [Loa loa]|uniref:NADPH--cytochrome P450 reductase n=1 Tax=Loa loa TaxID=7209 RepID=A0A1I7VKH9_LOALO|nr:FAD binding domain-containing protein [Loa loa]EFO27526.2 FAD binding domain-containing protein [Loa loa]